MKDLKIENMVISSKEITEILALLLSIRVMIGENIAAPKSIISISLATLAAITCLLVPSIKKEIKKIK